jgi:hypothetical protein
MIRRFLVRCVLGAAGSWLAATFIPGIMTDGKPLTFLLMGLFLGAGEIVLTVLKHGAAVLLFFLPSAFRATVLRAAIVAIAAGLVTGFGFAPPYVVGIAGMTLLLSLLFLLPFSS